MIVSMYMSEDVVTVRPDADGAVAAGLMSRYRVRCMPVVDDGSLVGVVSRTDLLRFAKNEINPFCAESQALGGGLGFTVREAMSANVATVEPGASIDAAARVLEELRLSSVIVVDSGRVVGVLSRTDILRAFREIMCPADGARFTLDVDAGVDVSSRLLDGTLTTHGLTLASFAEHRRGDRRFVFVSLLGPSDGIDELARVAWTDGVRVLQVERPVPLAAT